MFRFSKLTEMHVVMKSIPPIVKMDILIMYLSQLHRCLGFSFISIQDHNLAILTKVFFLAVQEIRL